MPYHRHMGDARRSRGLATAALAATAILAGCATAGAGPAPAEPGPAAPPADPEVEFRGVPGFDTRDYPGDEAMARWREASPYNWVGYYLPAPCYTGTSWQGRRGQLETNGWGLAVLFVGEQDWPERPDAPEPDPDDPRCTASNLTEERGQADAAAAARAAAEEGFATGTVIYLDVERVDAVSDRLVSYARAWTEALLRDGRFVPGLYAHGHNAPELLPHVRSAFRNAGRGDEPRLWVAHTRGFDVRSAPAESGFDAAIWQGRLDVDETWGGVTLRIDVNVADTARPSRP